MDFSLPFEFIPIDGLDFLRYRSRAKKQRLAGGVAIFIEESVQYDDCYVVLYYEWAQYLPVLAHFKRMHMHSGFDEDNEFEDDEFDDTFLSDKVCVLCRCSLSSENRSEVLNLCLNCFDNLKF